MVHASPPRYAVLSLKRISRMFNRASATITWTTETKACSVTLTSRTPRRLHTLKRDESLSKSGSSLSILLFAFYGIRCLVSRTTVAAFEHYRLPHLRIPTGILQLLGALGLALGTLFHPLLLIAAGGLAAMMFLAFLTRLRIHDPWFLALPSLTLCLLNLLLLRTPH